MGRIDLAAGSGGETNGDEMALDDDDMTSTEGTADGGANPGGQDGGADGGADSGAHGPADGGASSGSIAMHRRRAGRSSCSVRPWPSG